MDITNVLDSGQMQPLYEAMAISSSVIKMLEQEEDHQQARQVGFELQGSVANLVKTIEELLDLVARHPLGQVAPATLNGFVWCLDRLNSMTQVAVQKSREMLPAIIDDLRPAMELLLNQLEALADRVEYVLESWLLGASSDWSKFLDDAVARIGQRKGGVPDWRSALELLSD